MVKAVLLQCISPYKIYKIIYDSLTKELRRDPDRVLLS